MPIEPIMPITSSSNKPIMPIEPMPIMNKAQ